MSVLGSQSVDLPLVFLGIDRRARITGVPARIEKGVRSSTERAFHGQDLPESVVKPVRPASPELDLVRDDSVAAPVVWKGNVLVFSLVRFGLGELSSARDAELAFLGTDEVLELFPVLDLGRLWGSPGANSASERTGVKVRFGLFRSEAFYASTDTYRTREGLPEKREGAIRVFLELATLSRCVVGEEEEAFRVDLLEKHYARRGTRWGPRSRGTQSHGFRLSYLLRHGVLKPFLELLHGRRRQFRLVQPSGRVLIVGGDLCLGSILLHNCVHGV